MRCAWLVLTEGGEVALRAQVPQHKYSQLGAVEITSKLVHDVHLLRQSAKQRCTRLARTAERCVFLKNGFHPTLMTDLRGTSPATCAHLKQRMMRSEQHLQSNP